MSVPRLIETPRTMPGGADCNTLWYRIGPCSVASGRENGRWHMSIAHPRRLPTWDEIKAAKSAMEKLGQLDPEAVYAMPFPPKKAWLSIHDYCFHIWELRDTEMAEQWMQEGEIAQQIMQRGVIR